MLETAYELYQKREELLEKDEELKKLKQQLQRESKRLYKVLSRLSEEDRSVIYTYLGISGEIAEAKRLRNGTGNATFRNDLIDAVFNLTQEQLRQGVRYEIYKR